jgi:hypothetical protein
MPRNGRYCSACGQKAAPLNPTVGHFLREAASELFNLDGKIARTLKFLVTRPGFLTQEVFAGRRASYVSPLRLYLVLSVVAFAMGAVRPDEMAQIEVDFPPVPGEATSDADLQMEAAIRRAAAQDLPAALQRAMFVLVPVFAAIVMLVRRKSGLNYPQHLYFALHVHAMWFLVDTFNALLQLGGPIPYLSRFMDVATLLWSAAYLPLAFRRAYATTLAGAVWRCAIVGLLYVVALIVVLVAIFVPLTLRTMAASPP